MNWRSLLHQFKWGCLTAVLLVIGVPGATAAYLWYQAGIEEKAQLVKQKHKAKEEFAPVFETFDQAGQGPKVQYDIDKTMQVLHDLDRSLEGQSMEDWLLQTARRDFRNVAPEVLEARRNILMIQMKLHEKQLDAAEEEEAWNRTNEMLLGTLSMVNAHGKVNSLLLPSGKVGLDRKQARRLLKDMRKKKKERRRLRHQIQTIEVELFDALVDYADTYYRYMDEWDQLSLMRDRAYLAAHNGDWEAALGAAELAIQEAPMETEAHLIAAMAMIERGEKDDDARIQALLGKYIDDHPDKSAPALLLLGVNHARNGRSAEAKLSLQQSAAYYPRQSDKLSDMLDPYKARTFLKKSREGEFIVELYESTMLGAGYFSPDLQMAKLAFDSGDIEGGRVKVLDHFARRRTQKEWAFILSDVRFCHDLLGPHFWEIFPEEPYLDLEVSPAMWGNAINMQIRNRSPRVLHNATLVLALHYTDMYPQAYEAVSGGATVPAIVAHDVTDFGSIEVEHELHGVTKDVDDIVLHRAILISDEAVTWVDTNKFKISEDKDFRERRRLAKARKDKLVHPLVERHPEFENTFQQLLEGTSDRAEMETIARYGADDLQVELPRELTILKPTFRLRHADKLVAPSENVIQDEDIHLVFAGLENWDETPPTEDMQLLVSSPFGGATMTWRPDEARHWHFQGTEID